MMTRKQMQSPDFQPDIAVLNDVPRAQRSTLLQKHLIPIIHVIQNSPPPSILLNYNLINIINNMNPNKQSKKAVIYPTQYFDAAAGKVSKCQQRRSNMATHYAPLAPAQG